MQGWAVAATTDTLPLHNQISDLQAGKQDKLTLTTTGSGAATLTGATLNIPTPSGSQVTSEQEITASGSTTFTFTSVPATYSDYQIFRNGVLNESTTDYTTSGNVVTIPSVVSGDRIVLRRIK